MGCLQPALVLELLDGLLPPELARRAAEHLASCASCRLLVSELTRTRSVELPRHDITPEEPPPTYLPLPPERAPDEVFGRRYRLLDRLGQGGMGLVFRALDRLTGQAVALKLVSLRSPASPLYGSPFANGIGDGSMQLHGAGGGRMSISQTSEAAAPRSRLCALAQEFRTLVTLRHPNIISVLDYGFDAGRPYFTMELLSEARPLLPVAATVSPLVQLDLLVQLLRALTYLHRRGLVHRDLKPSNILVLPRAGTLAVKVLDFGLATQATDAGQSKRAGTPLYMAPEVLLGGAASERSDLYAVGVMAYQMLTGRHPFAGGVAGLPLVALPPGAPALADLPPPMRALLERTLSRAPAERPADAMTFLRELAGATGMELLAESPAVRDSYLVAARFVGRTAELGVLKAALSAARAGQGAAYLVNGESGVGKSRLMEELRSLALLEGVLVVRGQAISSGGTSFQLWQGVLPALVLHVELDALEASVLGAVLPGLALLERPVAARGTRHPVRLAAPFALAARARTAHDPADRGVTRGSTLGRCRESGAARADH